MDYADPLVKRIIKLIRSQRKRWHEVEAGVWEAQVPVQFPYGKAHGHIHMWVSEQRSRVFIATYQGCGSGTANWLYIRPSDKLADTLDRAKIAAEHDLLEAILILFQDGMLAEPNSNASQSDREDM